MYAPYKRPIITTNVVASLRATRRSTDLDHYTEKKTERSPEGETMANHPMLPEPQDQDRSKGAVEGDRPTDYQQSNKNAAGALDANGLPRNKVAIAEDVIG